MTAAIAPIRCRCSVNDAVIMTLAPLVTDRHRLQPQTHLPGSSDAMEDCIRPAFIDRTFK